MTARQKTFLKANLILFCLISFSFIVLIRISAAPENPNNKTCGNGVCQASIGEDVSTCPQDCGSTPTPTVNPTPNPTSTPTTNPTSTPTPTALPTVTITPTNQPLTPTPTETSNSFTPTPTNTNSNTTSELSYPQVTIDPFTNPTNNSNPVFYGTAFVQQGVISKVEYLLDASDWSQANPTEGSFDAKSERFTFKLVNLTEGQHQITIRAQNSEGIYTKEEQYAVATIVIVLTPPDIIFNPLSPNPTNNQTPTITVTANSSFATVEKAEVSIDNGLSWLLMEKKGNSFTKILNKLEDDNYPVIVRVYDNVGNQKTSEPQILIVDTIPPVIGGSLYSLGPQIIPPNNNAIKLITNADNSFVISMKGGVIKAQAKVDQNVYDLVRHPGSDLWFSKIKFKTNLNSSLIITATDGANNTTTRELNQIIVASPGTVLNTKNNQLISNAKLTLYYYQQKTKRWVIWNGESYGQKNPQITNSSGEYSYMVTPGKYYLEITAPNFQKTYSEIIEVSKITILNDHLKLQGKSTPYFFLSSIIPQTISLQTDNHTENPNPDKKTSLLNSPTPDLPFYGLSGEKISLSQYFGQNVLLTFISTWSPLSLEQTLVYAKLNAKITPDQKIMVIALQESGPLINTFMKRGKYQFPVFVDPLGLSAADYQISVLPQHYLIDKKGIIRKSLNGVLNENEALELFKNLP